ncbi:MAG: metal-dependent hydrolase [Lachnospiraceae bacterium]|nr:metal-dependent hydrolase [Lachnospiraceae bacterium]
MTSSVHTIGAVALGYGIIYVGKQIGAELSPVLVLGASVIGGLLPDIDHPKSKFGRKIKPVSTIIFAMFGHRTFTHGLLFTAIIGCIVSVLNVSMGTGLMVGMISHIILDLINPNTNGVAFLYPFYKSRINLTRVTVNKSTNKK